MKAVVYVLALLAALKIGSSEYLFRSSARDALVAAYRDRAIHACQKDGRTSAVTTAPSTWAKPGDIRLVVGKGGLDVYVWQVDHHLWDARYRNPYLLLVPADARVQGLVCEYDIVHNAAIVYRL